MGSEFCLPLFELKTLLLRIWPEKKLVVLRLDCLTGSLIAPWSPARLNEDTVAAVKTKRQNAETPRGI